VGSVTSQSNALEHSGCGPRMTAPAREREEDRRHTRKRTRAERRTQTIHPLAAAEAKVWGRQAEACGARFGASVSFCSLLSVRTRKSSCKRPSLFLLAPLSCLYQIARIAVRPCIRPPSFPRHARARLATVLGPRPSPSPRCIYYQARPESPLPTSTVRPSLRPPFAVPFPLGPATTSRPLAVTIPAYPTS
jgi:hypothetical protein